ncbi:MAG: immune inhibitor A [Anaerolineae bacterium]|nr:immune inhibitor A [Anaerolineae bacterium]
MKRRVLSIVMAVTMLLSMVAPTLAAPPSPDGPAVTTTYTKGPVVVEVPSTNSSGASFSKSINQPNLQDYQRIQERMRLLEAGQTAEAAALAQTGTDRVLVVLVEFGGPDEFVWEAPLVPYSNTTGSQWDPLGIADANEYTGLVGDCTVILEKIAAEMGQTLTDTLGMTKTFTYEGPKHNMIEKPRSLDDRSGDSIWSSDFSSEWFENFMFGNGVVISYTMQDDTTYSKSFLGQSVADYYSDFSSGTYTITGDIVGWLTLPHSTWYYDADQCPGARSGTTSVTRGAIPEGGNTRDLVADAMDVINAEIAAGNLPDFNWADYDQDGDGDIDRLWIVHAGYGEEDASELLNRAPVVQGSETITAPAAFYGESAVWSHSSGGRAYVVTTDPYTITAGAYIIMPENGGIGVFAHEYGHNLGADDLYSYGDAETTAGFWTLMADDWTGDPIGFEPPSVDPWHLDNWGWLNPLVIEDPTQEYEFYLGQASRFETNSAPGQAYRGAKIVLPDGQINLAVTPDDDYYWWGGKEDVANAMMTSKETIAVPSTSPALTFDLAYDIEDGGWDFLWVQVSTDGQTWSTLTNSETQCATDPSWIGGEYGFPDDLCAAGIGGFYGTSAVWPDYATQTFDLSAYAGQNIYVRFWYMTDWGTTGAGVFIDNIVLGDFSDDGESGGDNWNYAAPMEYSTGFMSFTHNFYLQWRNTGLETGGYDSTLGEPNWRFGPANSGLLVWYNNNFYTDNETQDYIFDEFSMGPKGRMLVVDSHPEPYRNPNSPYSNITDTVKPGVWSNEAANATSRGMMRDAPFSVKDTVAFAYTDPYSGWSADFDSRDAAPLFSDANGYYPGIELTKLSSASAYWYYITKGWDLGMAMPSKVSYGVKAPANYPDEGRYPNVIRYNSGWEFYSDGEVLAGEGNPGDVNGQYGWKVEVVEEATDGTWAKVRVYNEGPFEAEVTPEVIKGAGTYFITYTMTLDNSGSGVGQSRRVTVLPDSSLELVSTDWQTGTVYLPPAGTVEIKVLTWAGNLAAGEIKTLTTVFSATVSGEPMLITSTVQHEDFINDPTMTNLVTSVQKAGYNIFLPIVMRE